ncbi:hypothetical protein MGYG_03519 [Nannizzia gypsea CBS 118893]|uniref:BTB domain-containing protein n=1 Tax=Arthroderma gypseum (strain ATCC MYA-4604 / CBS 118893) TaxID=535722 RepID=E4USE8_ARTGP|nr:hypothetical protein MGYG_03519 [Nannizzia gypsea CBS 118893]EFR00515.1 hypothetical protein MGYG_03519 [Nannizzia gypsea CBS 118893]
MSVTNNSKVVVLQVGERKFHTTVETLTERSDYFKAYFSGKWTIPTMEDGSIFIDADSTAFEHVLRYLRRGVFPLAYDTAKGHDYHLYTSILQEATYFQCHHLVTWLQDQCYHKCVTWYASAEVAGEGEATATGAGNVRDMRLLQAGTKETKTYICPREIDVHRGDPAKCGRQCHNAQIGNPINYDIERLPLWRKVKTEQNFHSEWMTDDGAAFIEYVRSKEILGPL